MLRAALIRTTGIRKVYLHAEMFFQPPTPRELRAAVEDNGTAVFFVQLFEPPFDLVVHVIGVFRSNLGDDREPRLAIDVSCLS